MLFRSVAAVIWRVENIPSRWPFTSQVIDIAFFSAVIFFTSGPGSPFNVYFVFASLCGALRWQVRGTLITAATTLAVFMLFGIYFGFIDEDPAFPLRAFIIRGVYLIVLAVLIAYVAIYHQRMLRDMWLLANWPTSTPTHEGGLEPTVRQMLGHAESLFGVPAAALAWREPRSETLCLATWRRDSWSYARTPAGPPLVHPDLATRAFIVPGRRSDRTLVQSARDTLVLGAWNGEALTAEFGRRVGGERVLVVPVRGELASGQLFLLEKPDLALDDILVAEIMASVIAGRLDAHYFDEQLQENAAVEERIRLGRDLHDGVLQSFTGIALKLAAIRGWMTRDPELAAKEIEQLQRVLAGEQRELRFFIQDLKPSSSPQRVNLNERLVDLAARVEREWDLSVDLTVDVPASMPDRFARDVYHIVREALVNAARHGAASSASVRVKAESPDELSLSVVDDGHGFTFSGRYSAADLARAGIGPKTLRERVESLHGSLTLESGPGGAALHIVLPRAEAA